MSLRHYKSNFLPDVDFSTDGRLSFTQERSDGTFPLSAKGLKKYAADDVDLTLQAKKYESMDSRRRYQKNTNLCRNSSVRSSSTGTASSRLQRNFDLNWLSDPTQSSESQKISKLDLQNGHVQYNPRASFGSADSKIARKKLRDMDKLEIAQVSTDSTDVDEAPLVREVTPVIERPPAVLYVVIGVLLVLVGVVNTLLCPWFLYWCSIWTGAFILILGCLGICHGGSYFRPWQNWSYVVLGFLSSAAASVSIFLILLILVPFLSHLPSLVHSGLEHIEEPEFFSSEVNFTRWHPPVAESGPVLVWLSLACLVVLFILMLLSLHTTYGAMLVLSNFWDCEYRTTGVCNHHRRPAWFNPVDFLLLGQTCLVVGMMCVVVSLEIDKHRMLYWLPVASPVLGIVAVLFQLLSLAGLAIALALLTLGCVKDVAEVKEHIEGRTYNTDPIFWIHVTSLALYGIYVILSLVFATFVIGILVTHFRRLCSSDSNA